MNTICNLTGLAFFIFSPPTTQKQWYISLHRTQKKKTQLLSKESHTKASLTGQDYWPSVFKIRSIQEQVNHKLSTALLAELKTAGETLSLMFEGQQKGKKDILPYVNTTLDIQLCTIAVAISNALRAWVRSTRGHCDLKASIPPHHQTQLLSFHWCNLNGISLLPDSVLN